MKIETTDNEYFANERVGRILFKIAPPVMLAQLIQALYNIIDSFFVGRYSDEALTALSVVFPLQVIIISLSVGTGVGVNTYMARKFAQNREKEAWETAGTGAALAIVTWLLFAALSSLILRPYTASSAKSPLVVEYATEYGGIICIGSLAAFLDGTWTKVHQSRGNMRLPMAAQITGAFVNIVLDPVLIFGLGGFPKLGVSGAAYATVVGQTTAALITGIRGFRKPPGFRKILHYAQRIYWYGYSAILMEALCTIYIMALNMILAVFSDAAVTVLGLYYKLQSFFYIPLFGLKTCIVPLLSFNYAREDYKRCRNIMRTSILFSTAFMSAGIIGFIFFPTQIIGLFSGSPEVLEVGRTAFRIIGAGFVFAVHPLMYCVFFQAIGRGATSLTISLSRQILCLIPFSWLFSRIGLNFTWLAFPLSEAITGSVGLALYLRETRRWARLTENS